SSIGYGRDPFMGVFHDGDFGDEVVELGVDVLKGWRQLNEFEGCGSFGVVHVHILRQKEVRMLMDLTAAKTILCSWVLRTQPENTIQLKTKLLRGVCVP